MAEPLKPHVEFRAEHFYMAAQDGARCALGGCQRRAGVTYVSGGVRSDWCARHAALAIEIPEANGLLRC